jgi:hypothetical protein
MGNDKLIEMFECMFRRVGPELRYHIEQYSSDDVLLLMKTKENCSEEEIYGMMIDALVLVSTKLGIHVNEWRRGVAIYSKEAARTVATAMNFEMLELLWLVNILSCKHIPIFRDAKNVAITELGKLMNEFCYLSQIQDEAFLTGGKHTFNKDGISLEKINAVNNGSSIPVYNFDNHLPIWLNSPVKKETVEEWIRVVSNPWSPKELNEIEHVLDGINSYLQDWKITDEYDQISPDLMTEHISYIYTIITCWKCHNLSSIMALNDSLFDEYRRKKNDNTPSMFARYRDGIIVAVVNPTIDSGSTPC